MEDYLTVKKLGSKTVRKQIEAALEAHSSSFYLSTWPTSEAETHLINMSDALLMAMSSSGLSNIVLEDFMEVVPAYRISSDTIYELSSPPDLKQEEVEMLGEYSPKPAKRQRQQIMRPRSRPQPSNFSKAPIVPSFIKVLNNPRSGTQTGFPGVATVLLNKQREDQEAAERLLNKYKSAGMASLPPTLSWGSSNAFNRNKQNSSSANNGVFRAKLEPKLETNVFGLGGGEVAKRTVILKNMEKNKEPAAVDAKTTPHSIVMKPISTLVELDPKLEYNLAGSSTKTRKQATEAAAGAKTTAKQDVIKRMPTLVENSAQRFGLVAGTIKAILSNPNLNKAFVVQVFLLDTDQVSHQQIFDQNKKLKELEPKIALPQILNVRHKGIHFYNFYRTQVNLGSDLWVRLSGSESCFWNLTDVNSGWWRYQVNTYW